MIYYNSIWRSIIDNIKNESSFIGRELAGVLSLINEPITPKMLHSIFIDNGLSESHWTYILDLLSPLIIYENGKYRPLVNDVNVFLNGIANTNRCVVQCADKLANYYLALESPNITYYKDLFNILEIAKREKEIIEIFNAEYSYKSYVTGLTIAELNIQAINVLKLISYSPVENWLTLNNIACGFITLERIRETIEHGYGTRLFDKKICQSLYEVECYVEPIENWTLYILNNVFQIINDLINNDEYDRAESLYLRWFGELKFIDIVELIKKEINELNPNDEITLTDKGNDFFKLFGNVSFYIHNNINIEINNTNNFEIEVESSFYNGFIDGILENTLGDIFIQQIKNFDSLPYGTINKIVIYLLKEGRLSDLHSFSSMFPYSEEMNVYGKLIISSAHIMTNTFKYSDKTIEEIQSDFLNFNNIYFDYHNEGMVWGFFNFNLGYLQCNCFSGTIADIALKKYIENYPNGKEREESYLKVFFALCANLGKWVYHIHNSSIAITQSNIDITKLIHQFNFIFNRKWSPNEKPLFNDNDIMQFILELLLWCADETGDTHKSEIDEVLNCLYKCFKADYSLECGWGYYVKRNDLHILNKWFDKYFGDNGDAWDWSHSERCDTLLKFIDLIDKYNLHENINIDKTINRITWSIIEYRQDKEYIMQQANEWYESIVKFDNTNWKSAGIMLVSLAVQIHDVASNKLKSDSCELFVSAVFNSGIGDIWDIYNSENFYDMLRYDRHNVINAIINLLEHETFNEVQLNELWSYGIGILDWRNKSDQTYVLCLREAILKKAEMQNIKIENDLYSFTKAEYFMEVAENEYVPTYWFDDIANKITTIDISNIDDEINLFFDLVEERDVKKYLQLKSIVSCLKNLQLEIKNHYINIILGKLFFSNEQHEYGYYGLSDGRKIEYLQIIFPEMDEQEIMLFLSKIIDLHIKNNLNIYWDYIYNDISSICRLALLNRNPEKLIHGLNSFFEMHNLWLTGNGNLTNTRYLKMTNSVLPKPDFNLTDFIIHHLIYIVKTKDAEYVGCALKGLWGLARTNQYNLPKIFNYWDELNDNAQEWMLIIIERCLQVSIIDVEIIISYLIKASESPYLNVMIYANVLLSKIKKTDPYIGELTIKEQTFFSEIDVLPKGKKIITYKRNDSFISGNLSVKKRLDKIKAICGDRCEDIESIFMEYYGSILNKDYSYEEPCRNNWLFPSNCG